MACWGGGWEGEECLFFDIFRGWTLLEVVQYTFPPPSYNQAKIKSCRLCRCLTANRKIM